MQKFNFEFSLYQGDILEVERQNGIIEKVKFKGVNADECKNIRNR